MRFSPSLSALSLLIGCAGPLAEDSATSDTSPEADQDLDSFFSLQRIHQVSVELDDEAWDDLLDAPNEYVQGDIEIDGIAYDDVGVRLKGGAGSFVPLDGDYPEESGDGNGNPGKSAFLLNLDKFVDDQEHLGLEKLTVNNLVQDDSCIHETAGYALFREAGVPAPRTAYADVSLNGESKGLYLLVESQDNSLFLEDWYDSDEGNLYEGAYGQDLAQEHVEHFDQDNGDDESREDLYALAAALDEVEAWEGDESYELLRSLIDMDEYLDFAATEIYLGHWDGYSPSANNYKIHHDPDSDRWTFLPWGADQLFEDSFGEYGGVMMEPGPSWHGGRVHELCFRSEACRHDLHDAFEDVLSRVESMELAELAAGAQALVEAPALEESTAYGDPELTRQAWDQVERFMAERPEHLQTWLSCLAGEPLDHDGDGYNGCTEDPEDWNPEVGG